MIRLTCYVLLALTFVIPLASLADKGERSKPMEAPSLCSLVQDPKKFTGKRVRLETNLESDGMHGAWLEDVSCKASVALVTAHWARKNSDIKGLEETIFHGMGRAGTVSKEIRAVFEGRFLHRTTGKPQYEFEMEAVSNIRMSPRNSK
jgi:hypothetical protein